MKPKEFHGFSCNSETIDEDLAELLNTVNVNSEIYFYCIDISWPGHRCSVYVDDFKEKLESLINEGVGWSDTYLGFKLREINTLDRNHCVDILEDYKHSRSVGEFWAINGYMYK